ncbi:hypothetical protein O6H91_07G065900 [Diphasiastrum complanatum]|uniref:Uncharacterized protein n=1 Tax=Diphasiastrum complanatum TaxID=34168 RepID=A0ACC2D661_DIPCM|nr:hypothetical protein O6H91_Y552000 [Diphasiastrum complanatum]KAJ7549738.1 hypothetical protein O6H91_07G065900 [Diphasiastrum complanatum]
MEEEGEGVGDNNPDSGSHSCYLGSTLNSRLFLSQHGSVLTAKRFKTSPQQFVAEHTELSDDMECPPAVVPNQILSNASLGRNIASASAKSEEGVSFDSRNRSSAREGLVSSHGFFYDVMRTEYCQLTACVVSADGTRNPSISQVRVSTMASGIDPKGVIAIAVGRKRSISQLSFPESENVLDLKKTSPFLSDPLKYLRGAPKKKIANSNSSVTWKSKRGKFAESSSTDLNINSYPWMPFFKFLKTNPTHPEFVYLQPPMVASAAFDPYNLEIVTHSELNSSNYYTMSSSGVTLYRYSEAEFVHLDEWERDCEYYICLMKLSVFQQYKQWKSFAIWRHYLRRKLQATSRKALRRQLFLVNPVLQKVLIRVRQMLEDILAFRFYKLEHESVYTLEKFVEVQESRRENLMIQIMQFSHNMVRLMREACAAVLAMVEQELMGQTIGDGQSSSKLANRCPALGRRRSGGNKLANVAAKWKMDKEKVMEERESQERFSFAIAATRRNEKSKLLSFLRLVDYMITDSLLHILIRSLSELLYQLAHHTVKHLYLPQIQSEDIGRERAQRSAEKDEMHFYHSKKQQAFSEKQVTVSEEHAIVLGQAGKVATLKVFEVELILKDNQIVLLPSCTDFQNKLELLLKAIISGLRNLKRLVYQTELDEMVEKQTLEGDGLFSYMDLIGESQYDSLMSSICSSLLLAFQDAELLKLQFQPFLDISIENQSITLDRMEAEVGSYAILVNNH